MKKINKLILLGVSIPIVAEIAMSGGFNGLGTGISTLCHTYLPHVTSAVSSMFSTSSAAIPETTNSVTSSVNNAYQSVIGATLGGLVSLKGAWWMYKIFYSDD